jgi:hypothetical protein
VTLPEDLIEKVAACPIDARAVLEKALHSKLDEISQWDNPSLTPEQKEALKLNRLLAKR